MIQLTENHKVLIRKLKSDGFIVKEIASRLSLPYGTVKKYLQRHPVSEAVYCKCCGKEIEKKDNRKRLFCSKKCKDKYWSVKSVRSPEYLIEKVCLECGRTFYSHPSRRRIFCSRLCFQKHESRKWREVNGEE